MMNNKLATIFLGEGSSYAKDKYEMQSDSDFSKYSQMVDFYGFVIGIEYPKTKPLTIQEKEQRLTHEEKWKQNERLLLDTLSQRPPSSLQWYGSGYVEIQQQITNLKKILFENNVEQIVDLIDGHQELYTSDFFKVSLLHLISLFGSLKVMDVYLSKFRKDPEITQTLVDYGGLSPQYYAILSGNYEMIQKWFSFLDDYHLLHPYLPPITYDIFERLSRAFGHIRNASYIYRKTEEKKAVTIPSLLSITIAVVGSTLSKYKAHPSSLERKRVLFPVSFSISGKNNKIIEGSYDYFLVVASIFSGSPTALEKLVLYLCEYCPEHCWEVLNELKNLLPLKSKISMTHLIHASQVCEAYWRKLYVTFLPHLDQPTMVNIYEEYNTFVIEPEDHFERELGVIILKKERGLVGSPSVVNLEQFKLQFKAFTRGLLENLDWSNVVLMGGSIIGSLLPLPPHVENHYDTIAKFYSEESEFKGSDIDIYIYGLDSQATKEKVKQIYTLFEKFKEEHKLDLVVTSNDHILTLSLFYPYRNTQIPVGRFDDIFHILCGADLDSSCFAYNGQTVYTLPRGRLSVNRKWNYLNIDAEYNSRESPFFEQRILKYNQRGFSIVDPNYKSETELSDKFRESLNSLENFDLINNPFYGLGLLLACQKSKEVHQAFLAQSLSTGLPFGPEWDKEKYINEVDQKYQSLLSGYSRDEALPQIITPESVMEKISGYNTYFNFDLNNTKLSDYWYSAIIQ